MSGKRVGYVRVSTVEQNLERQLVSVDLDKVFEEKASAKTADRPKLREMLDYIREGDEVYVHDISRLARNIEDLHGLVREITSKGCSLHFQKENLAFSADQTDPFSQLLLSMLGAVYQFERSILLERQKEGIAVAKAAGKYKGRPTSLDHDKIKAMRAEGMGATAIARELGCTRGAIYKVLKA